MTVKIGINGFGRIGRLTLRAIKQYHSVEMEVKAINDLGDAAINAHLFKWDSTYGAFAGDVAVSDDNIFINGKDIKVIAERNPADAPWSDYGVDIVIESSGIFTDAAKAAAHLGGSVKKVLISAPAKNEDITVVLGVNQDKYQPDIHNVISNASCTTNCLAPVAKVIDDNLGIVKGLMTTVHAYTNDQRLQDTFHKDLRRARAAAENMILTTTGAAKAIGRVLPQLEGKLLGGALRVPVATVSIVDLTVEIAKNTTADELNRAFKDAADGNLKGILEYCSLPLVSSDFKGNPASCIVDAASTLVTGGNMAKVLAWYDNEWGYCCRLADLVKFVADKGL
ncbi:type I glyceraldehyde-3-phosphate dehydrogenase [Chloroflexota bacterium]